MLSFSMWTYNKLFFSVYVSLKWCPADEAISGILFSRTHCIKVSSSCLGSFAHAEALLVTIPIPVIDMCLCVWLWESKVTTTPGVRQGAEGNIHHHESCHAGISIRRLAAVAASRWDRETLAENVLCHYSKFYFAATGAGVDGLCFFLTVSMFLFDVYGYFQCKANFSQAVCSQ